MYNPDPKTFQKTMEKLYSGEAIPDTELENAIICLNLVISYLDVLGAKYFFANRELKENLNQLKSFKEARKEQ